MKRKPGIFCFVAILMLLSANYLLIKVPFGSVIDLGNIWYGVGLFAVSALISFANILSEKTLFKSNIYYKPKVLWFIGFLVFVEGVILIIYSSLNVYITNVLYIKEMHINIIAQLLVSLGIIALVHEFYSYMYEYPVRMALKVMENAGQMIESKRFLDAQAEFDKVQRKFGCSKHPHIYGWIKRAKGICFMEMSKHEEKKKNLLMAVKEFEEILKLEELQGQHGQIKVDIGNIYFDLAEYENNMKYYENALDMYTDALKQYKTDKDVDGYMNALRNAERTKTVLVLEKSS
ncbi:MAG: hypothetical protein BWY74_02957 [Firmicutes bacterium ADurb.Bin419]|nr:MAG: hypothetical protein BWY74_02957 [Firmicutes bacterium ADurb.Bin419]